MCITGSFYGPVFSLCEIRCIVMLILWEIYYFVMGSSIKWEKKICLDLISRIIQSIKLWIICMILFFSKYHMKMIICNFWGKRPRLPYHWIMLTCLILFLKMAKIICCHYTPLVRAPPLPPPKSLNIFPLYQLLTHFLNCPWELEIWRFVMWKQSSVEYFDMLRVWCYEIPLSK